MAIVTGYTLDADERFIIKSIGIAEVPDHPGRLALGVIANRQDGTQVAHEYLVAAEAIRGLLPALSTVVERLPEPPTD